MLSRTFEIEFHLSQSPSAVRRPSVPRFLFLPHPAGNRVADVLMGFHSPPLPLSLSLALLCSAAKSFFLSLLPRPHLLFFRTSHKNKCTCVQYRYLSKVRLFAKWAVSTLELVLRDDHENDCPVCSHFFLEMDSAKNITAAPLAHPRRDVCEVGSWERSGVPSESAPKRSGGLNFELRPI